MPAQRAIAVRLRQDRPVRPPVDCLRQADHEGHRGRWLAAHSSNPEKEIAHERLASPQALALRCRNSHRGPAGGRVGRAAECGGSAGCGPAAGASERCRPSHPARGRRHHPQVRVSQRELRGHGYARPGVCQRRSNDRARPAALRPRRRPAVRRGHRLGAVADASQLRHGGEPHHGTRFDGDHGLGRTRRHLGHRAHHRRPTRRRAGRHDPGLGHLGRDRNRPRLANWREPRAGAARAGERHGLVSHLPQPQPRRTCAAPGGYLLRPGHHAAQQSHELRLRSLCEPVVQHRLDQRHLGWRIGWGRQRCVRLFDRVERIAGDRAGCRG